MRFFSFFFARYFFPSFSLLFFHPIPLLTRLPLMEPSTYDSTPSELQTTLSCAAACVLVATGKFVVVHLHPSGAQ